MSRDQELTLMVETTQGNWEGVFSKTTKVSELIELIRQHFGFSGEGKYQLKLTSGETMRPERPLVSYNLKDGDHLIFVDLGVAV